MDSFATPDRRPRSTVGSTGGKRSWDSVGRVIPDSDKRIKTGESVAVDSQQEVAESEEDDDVVPVCLRMLFIPHARSTRSSTLNHAAQHPDEPHANGQRALSFFALTRLCPAGYPVPPALNDGALDRVGSMWALLSSLHAQLSSFQSFVKTCLERSLQPRSPILHAPTHSSHALLTLICPIPRSPPLPPPPAPPASPPRKNSSLGHGRTSAPSKVQRGSFRPALPTPPSPCAQRPLTRRREHRTCTSCGCPCSSPQTPGSAPRPRAREPARLAAWATRPGHAVHGAPRRGARRTAGRTFLAKEGATGVESSRPCRRASSFSSCCTCTYRLKSCIDLIASVTALCAAPSLACPIQHVAAWSSPK